MIRKVSDFEAEQYPGAVYLKMGISGCHIVFTFLDDETHIHPIQLTYDKSWNLLYSIEYKHGTKNGNTIRYMEDCYIISSVTTYCDGVKHGPEYEYDLSGSIIMYSKFVEGRLNGHKTYYMPDGRRVEDWAYGQLISTTEYYKNTMIKKYWDNLGTVKLWYPNGIVAKIITVENDVKTLKMYNNSGVLQYTKTINSEGTGSMVYCDKTIEYVNWKIL